MTNVKPFIFPFFLDDKGKWHNKKGRFVKKSLVQAWFAKSEKFVKPAEKVPLYRCTFVAKFPLQKRWKTVRYQAFDVKPMNVDLKENEFIRKLAKTVESLPYAVEIVSGTSHSSYYINYGVEENMFIGEIFEDEVPLDELDEYDEGET